MLICLSNKVIHRSKNFCMPWKGWCSQISSWAAFWWSATESAVCFTMGVDGCRGFDGHLFSVFVSHIHLQSLSIRHFGKRGAPAAYLKLKVSMYQNRFLGSIRSKGLQGTWVWLRTGYLTYPLGGKMMKHAQKRWSLELFEPLLNLPIPDLHQPSLEIRKTISSLPKIKHQSRKRPIDDAKNGKITQ